MFEVGKRYRITMIESANGEWSDKTSVWIVVAMEGTLVKLQNSFLEEMIVNTGSWRFVRAELDD